MQKRTKYIVGAVGIGVIVLALIAAAVAHDQPVDVRIETVQSRDLTASVQASGQVRPHTKVDISADITGRITRLAVKEGDIVTKGQFLLEIDPSQYRAAVERSTAGVAASQAQMAQARANADQAKRSYARIAELQRRNPALVSMDQLEQARTTAEVNKALYDNARHGVDEARGALRDAQSSLNKTTIVAPIAGRVTRLNVEQGETAIMGTLNKDAATLLTISDMSDFETRVKVNETDVAHIKLGNSALVDIDAFPDSTFRGIVTDVSSSSVLNAAATSTDQAIDYYVTVRLLNAPPDTRPDFSAQAKIITATRRNVLSIPIIALTVRENTPLANHDSAVTYGKAPARQVGQRDVEGVFVIDAKNRVTFRPVKVGVAGEQYFEVVSGLTRGERIVAGTYQAIRDLKDGMRVREAPANKSAKANGS